MTTYKNKKDGRTYLLKLIEAGGKKIFVALPIKHDGKPIVGCDPKDFVVSGKI